MKMKPNSLVAACVAAFAIALVCPLSASEGHDHGHEHTNAIAGPNGGRILTGVEPHLEFFVMEDRKVKITAVNDDGKPVPLGGQSVTVVGGDRMNPTRLTFTKEGDSLVSDRALPDGNDFPVVIQIKVTPDAKTAIAKFNVNLSICPGCKLREYACICGH